MSAMGPGPMADGSVAMHNVVMGDASDTVAYITGASRGIGRLVATSLADDGARVAAFARPSDDLDSLGSQVGAVVPIPMDVADPTSVTAAFAKAEEAVGAPTLLVTFAGSMDALGPIASVDPERWWRTVTVDLRGTMLCAQGALSSMLPRGTGRIVTVYGNLGDDGRENVSAFAVAKAGIARFTETLATELAGTGVMAVCMHPGFVHTPMTEHLASSPAGRQWLPEFGHRAANRWGDGASAVDLMRRIVAGDADILTGRVIYAGDDLPALTSASGDPELHRLRIHSST